MTTTTNDWPEDLDLPEDDGFGTPEYSFGDFDMDGVDGNKIGSGAVYVEKPGFYHFEIKAEARPAPHDPNDMSKQRKPSISCRCKVLKSVQGLSAPGALHFHDLILGGKGGGPITDRDRDSTLNFLVGLGVLKSVDGRVIDPETGTTKVNSNTLVDRINKIGQFVGKLSLNAAHTDATGKAWPERIEFSWGRGAFPVTAKEVAHVPKCEKSLAEAGISPATDKPPVNT